MARTAGTTHRLLERLQRGFAVVSEEHHLQMTPGTELVVLLCTDVVAPVGDDEILVLLTDVTGLGDVETVAHRMEREMLSPVTVRETQVSLQAEMGIALYPDHGSSLEELVRTADRAISGRGAGPSQAM